MTYDIIYFYSLKASQLMWQIYDGWIFLDHQIHLGTHNKVSGLGKMMAKHSEKDRLYESSDVLVDNNDIVWYMNKEYVCCMLWK